jgi:transcriptional regulator with XRE-family HTH domain
MAEAHKERVGQAIRQRRKELDLSAEELGRQIPVSGKTVERWERGETFGHMDNLDRVAELLETDVATLMAGPAGEKGETPDVLGQLDEERGLKELLAELSAAVDAMGKQLEDLRAGQIELLAEAEREREAREAQREPRKPGDSPAAEAGK